ncbi:PspA/IM30 family protein [Acetobacterium woodii]|uniref:Putative phage shock protein A n=1 Tax=Acetobacterium woodii (strain ATCC 29683 / DSM 1030 / JCM 2381 / KCTC 1655 / WB1) TaxID=931626 RepID=H6LIK7_ACEWD|nr:PspA/IM30 family protein [Acetobacterium woodii]AFA48581.1 putative phage shock protein A [Acetobacterium woodii DSM 1030]
MAILERFSDIIRANINDLLDKMEDPAIMIDQYLIDLLEDLAEVKRSTAEVMGEETRTKRLVDSNNAELEKYASLAKKALVAGNEGDARTFLTRKQELENQASELMDVYAAAHENAMKMRQMHDKLATDIQTLQARRTMIKSKVSIAKTQEILNQASSSTNQTGDAMNAFTRMEAKADHMLDEANAMAELNILPVDPVDALEEKYGESGNTYVDEELAKLKKELGLSQ